MINRKRLIQETEFNTAIEGLIQTYTLIAAGRIQKIRNAVLKNREFIKEISQIYQDLKDNYHQELEKVGRANATGSSGKNVIPKNGRTVFVLVSANAKLYGDIVPK